MRFTWLSSFDRHLESTARRSVRQAFARVRAATDTRPSGIRHPYAEALLSAAPNPGVAWREAKRREYPLAEGSVELAHLRNESSPNVIRAFQRAEASV
ncbi:MAG: hypothetical protein ACRD26_06835 [Vicinamibacterales bacterium]